jgi:hypothetical protein
VRGAETEAFDTIARRTLVRIPGDPLCGAGRRLEHIFLLLGQARPQSKADLRVYHPL